jgi:GNAT superfamily N-acetyltransferase
MGPEHLDGAAALSRAEDWPHRIEDWAFLLSGSQGVVALEEDQVVATTLVVPAGPVATAGMILVDERRRGRGLGRRVLERAMAQLSPAEWRLVATEDGLPLYRRLGFEVTGEVLQQQGLAQAAPGGLPQIWAGEGDVRDLAALDRAATGMERAWLLSALLREGRVLINREAGQIEAFAALRPFGRGELVGPLVARSQEEARALLATLLSVCEGRFLRVDTPEGSGLGSFLAEHALKTAGSGLAMSRGSMSLALGPHRCFALAAQALG